MRSAIRYHNTAYKLMLDAYEQHSTVLHH